MILESVSRTLAGLVEPAGLAYERYEHTVYFWSTFVVKSSIAFYNCAASLFFTAVKENTILNK